MSYPLLKLIHILSATLMIGTGLGSAFYLYLTYRKSDYHVVKSVLKLVILADAVFTAPSVIIQLVTGLMLSEKLHLTWSVWFWVVLGASFFIVVLWIPAALIQVKLRNVLEKEDGLTEKFHALMKIWFYLGIASFLGALYIYYLMVFKPVF